jgi:hypothetical protein
VTVFDQVINTIMPGNDVFTFTINTSQTLSGTYTLRGYASALVSASTTLFTGAKDDGGLSFSLPVSVATPEPATWTSLCGGLLALCAFLCFRKSSRPSGSPGSPIDPKLTNSRSGD